MAALGPPTWATGVWATTVWAAGVWKTDAAPSSGSGSNSVRTCELIWFHDEDDSK